MRQSYHSYAKKNGYSLTRRQLIYWAKTHKAAKECGDEKNNRMDRKFVRRY